MILLRSALLLFSLLVLIGCWSESRTQPKATTQKFVFSNTYFTAHIHNWKKWTKDLAGKPNLKYLEVGVEEGRSAFWVLDNILTDKSSQATLVDPFFPSYEARFLSNLDLHPRKNQTQIKKGLSEHVLPLLPENSYDFIYIDGSHQAKNVFLDAAYCWRLLKKGGLLIFDDYGFQKEKAPIVRPEVPIDTFLMAFEKDIEIVSKEYQVVIKKR